MRRALGLGALLLSFFLPTSTRAQGVWRPEAEWRTVETEHFVIHYPRELERWTLNIAERLESVRVAVGREVGSLPRKRVSVLVTDPLAVSNGFALPFLESPAIVLWPTPPEPRSAIGNSRSWAELLAVHEFAHVAHLTRPSRNPRERLLVALAPLGIGPVARKSPRWVIEGYATYVEGRLTGSGRPHGAWRPAVLRQWALEGRLPTYGQLSGWDEYNGGSFAYLGGSAFLEWLADRRGDSTVTHLWRRLSARRQRNFDDAFAGVYGGSPRALYGRFTAELTGQALAIERTLRDSGLVEGALVQRLTWTTGDPALSPDGSRMAIVLRAKDRPSRIVVWKTEAEPPDTAAEARRKRERERDPEDVPDVAFHPRAKRPVATLRARAGIGFDAPRFMPDGMRILVTRFAPKGNGDRVPDLYLWDTRSGGLRRVTRGANLRNADPSPDGRQAAAIRCRGGLCSLVEVTIATGAIAELATATPEQAFHRPRYASDGQSIFVSTSVGGRWRLARWSRATGLVLLGPDDNNRYDAQPTADGRGLLHVTEAGGIPNVALLDLRDGSVRNLTRVTSAAVAPVPEGRNVYFLALHSTGWDLRRISLDSVAAAAHVVAIDPRLAPAAAVPPVAADTFAALPLAPSRAYGVGPREYRFLYAYSLAADGREGVAGVASTDKVGRFSWIVQGAYGSVWRPRGAALAAAWRGTRPVFEAELFTMSRDPSRQRPSGFTTAADDHDIVGGTLAARTGADWIAASYDARVGGSWQRLRAAEMTEPRAFLFAALRGGLRQQGEQRFASQQLQLQLTRGRSPDRTGSSHPFERGIGTASVAVGGRDNALRMEATYGSVGRNAAPFERFVVGGASPAYVDDATFSQWLEMPALPFGTLRGRQVAAYRLAVGGAFAPYYWAASAGESFDDWMRVVGIEARGSVPTIALIRLPAAEARIGAGYSLDEPWRRRARAYLTLRYRP